MALWGKNDAASNSVIYAVNQFGVTANSDNRTAFYGNTTQGAIQAGVAVGQFAVSAAEAGVDGGPVVDIVILTSGSGYTANATVTLTAVNGGSSAVANAQANATGRIAALNVSTAGSGYKSSPTVTVAAPAATAFNANTAVTGGTGNNGNSVITIASAGKFAAGDKITYAVAAGNTAVSPLVTGTQYFVQFANSTVVALAATKGGSRIVLVPSDTSETGHTLQGETATGVASVGGGANKKATAGWNIRKEGSGGRAGRVQYECLVAMRNITGDGSDDTVLPDA
jgi:hypothetical protein